MKSWVSLEQKICAVCVQQHDSGALLLNKRLRESMDEKTVTGRGMCPACQQKEDDGFIALVEIDPSASTNTNSLEGVFRTGRIAHLKIDAFRRLFTTPLENIPNHPKMVFVDHEVMEHLIGMMPGEAENEA